ncbi:MAG: hypothetical protein RRY42_01795 [Mucinivorans sp.]
MHKLLLILLAFALLPCAAQDGSAIEKPLNAYGDFMDEATDFSLSFLRFSPRGHTPRQSEFRLNGVLLNDPQTGLVPWAALGQLNSMVKTRTQHSGVCFGLDQTGIGAIGGGQYLTFAARQEASGGRVVAAFSNRTYTFRLGASYNLHTKNGWGLTIDAGKRFGRSLTTSGVWGDQWSGVLVAEKQLDASHNLQFTLIAAPTARATAAPATDEAFALAADNLYNPSWGVYGGDQRSVRVRRTVEPIAMLTHNYVIDTNLSLHSALMVRLGSSRRSALDWQNAPNPLPDYWGAMPSAQLTPQMADQVAALWRTDQGARQINFDQLTRINILNGERSKYAIADRVSDVLQATFQSSIAGLNFAGGVSATIQSTENYREMSSLLGGDYWLDIDSFVEMDDDVKELTQNNLRDANRHIRVGDRFGYNYLLNTFMANLWGAYTHHFERFSLTAGASVTPKIDQRVGRYEKENFPSGRSYGASQPIFTLDYLVKAMATYAVGSRLVLDLALAYGGEHSPSVDRFISLPYRNAPNPELGAANVFSGEFNVRYRTPRVKVSGSLFYGQTTNGTQKMNLYDDLRHVYVHYSMRDVAQRGYGLLGVAEFSLPVDLSISVALAAQNNIYVSDPIATEYAESTGALVAGDVKVLYQGLHTALAPELAGVASLAWQPYGWIVSLTAVGQAGAYAMPSPVRRTYDALEKAASGDAIQSMLSQQALPAVLTLDLFAGRSWYFDNEQSLGIYCGVNNLLDSRSIKSTGYESSRLRNIGSSWQAKLTPHATKYYYATGINYFVNVTYRF